MSKNLTKKQKALIKGYFCENFDEFIESDLGIRAVRLLVSNMRLDLWIFLSLNRKEADVAHCNNMLSMFERILDSDSLKTEEEKEVSSE